MPQLLKIPREVEKVLGIDAPDKLYDFLNQAFEEQTNRYSNQMDTDCYPWSCCTFPNYQPHHGKASALNTELTGFKLLPIAKI